MTEEEKPKEYAWVQYIRQRVLKRNKNFLATMTGPTGSGKSWTALSIAKMVDPDFDIDQVVFRGLELLKLVNSGKLKPGSVIIWDEAGIDLSNRNWQSTMNKMINYLLQTFRHKNFVLIFTVPYHDFVDTASRKLFHADFKTVSLNKKKKTVRLKAKMLQYNSELKKWYTKYLIMKTDKGMVKVRNWYVPKPDDNLIERYENKKNMFTGDLNQELGNKLEELEPKQEDEEEKGELTEFQQQIVNLWDKGIVKPIEVWKEIQKLYPQKIYHTRVYDNYKFLKNKGYKPPKNDKSTTL